MGMRNTLLLADDMGSNRAFLRRIFEEDYDILEAETGGQVLRLMDDNRDSIVAVLLDLVMPGMDGYQVLAEMNRRGYLKEIPVIVVTSDSSKKSEARVLELGAFDLVAKPYDPFIIRRRVHNLAELNRSRRRLSQQVGEMAEVMNATNASMVNALATITEFRSLESGQHILRIRKFTEILLREVARSFPEYELDEKAILTISSASVLHDIGKVSIPDSILNKPGRLTKEEFDEMKAHTTAGCTMLERMTNVGDREYMRYAYNICRYHHERWDGNGYPDGLKGSNIPMCAQVVAIADVYDALTTKRVYKDAIMKEKAVTMILNGECGSLNPQLLECFKRVQEEMASCAQSYADEGAADGDDLHIPLPKPKGGVYGISAQQMSTIKYHALLGYVGGVVIEVDVDSGAYHLVYDEHKLFANIRNDGDYDSFVDSLVKGALHPDQQEEAREFYAHLKAQFFQDGLRRHSRRFLVKPDPNRDYYLCECTHLRLDTGDPSQHKAIVAWRPVEEGGEAVDSADRWGENELRDLMGCVLVCRSDKWQTIIEGGRRLADMLGYTEEELEEKYGNSLLEMILHEDRESVMIQSMRQLNHTATSQVEYRFVCKDGRLLWVYDKLRIVVGEDGTEWAYHVLVDNTPIREMEEKLKATEERYKILLNQIDDVTFEWDVARDVMRFSHNFAKQFGAELEIKGFSKRVLEGRVRLHPQDVQLLQAQVGQLMAHRDCPSFFGAELRIRGEDGEYQWRRLRAYAQQKENGKAGYIVGLLMGMDTDKHADAGVTAAGRDGLTNLLNLAAARESIEAYLYSRVVGERAAMIMVDIDRFSEVNLRYGRMAGDALLMQAAIKLTELVSAGDIVARVGGDEFLILVKNLPTQEVLNELSERIMWAVASMSVSVSSDIELSCCIGISLMPEDGSTFEELSERASRALNKAKGYGCGHFTFFQQGEDAAASRPALGSEIESVDLPGSMGQRLIQYSFHRLYESGDVQGTIQGVLETVGRQLNVSRVYIFENSPDNRYCRNTFEWCNDGITTQIDKLGDLYYDGELAGIRDLYNERGLLICNDISTLSDNVRKIAESEDIKSMIHCAMMDGDVFRGFVGFDECVEDREWTGEQIDLLAMMVELTAVFLFKERAKDATERWAQSMVDALEHLNLCIYVIDPESCEILFSNSRMRELAPAACEGALCHKAFMGMEARCESCVADGIKALGKNRAELHNPMLNARVSANASLIDWEGREAAIVVCDRIE